MRIYVGPRLFNPCLSWNEISSTLYHEFTHKILHTSDTPYVNEYVTGDICCQALAKTNPFKAIQTADCWRRFVVSLKNHLFVKQPELPKGYKSTSAYKIKQKFNRKKPY